MESSEETKIDGNENAEPPKPSFIDKLKAKRWTFKVKNNLTKYVTVEPLICFYMAQIFAAAVIQPYHFHKACVSLEQDTSFCDVITINPNHNYKLCAAFNYQRIYCKGLGEGIEKIDCDYTIKRYENNKSKPFERPEDYRFCKVIENTDKVFYTKLDSLTGISAMILTLLVVMTVSIWSDKYSKRKMCLLLPIFGQLVTSFINLYGALSTFLSFAFIDTATKYITSLSGGMPLFLFGCFSYMNDDTIRHKLLFRFGVIALILTIYRYIPHIYYMVYEYYRDDDSYLNLISLNLVFNIVCLLYVKVVLNESKQETQMVNGYQSASESLNSEVQSIKSTALRSISNSNGNKARKYTKRKKVAKAFSLDIIWDYILMIFKKRAQSGRLIIILFLAIVLIEKTSPYDERLSFIINTEHKDYLVDIIDIDGAIFIFISIMMALLKVPDIIIAILVMGIPTAARLAMVILSSTLGYSLKIDSSATDFYSPFKRIASCSLLLAYFNNNESRIFLIVQLIAYLPKAVFQTVSSKNVATIFDTISTDSELFHVVQVIVLVIIPILVFIGLGLLCVFVKKNEKFKIEQKPPKPIEDITTSPWTFIQPVNFQNENKSANANDQPPPIFQGHEYSTDL